MLASSWIRRLLTERITRIGGSSRKLRVGEVPPSERLVLLFEFSLIDVIALTTLEIAHLAFPGVWNSEVFAAITVLVGTAIGIIIGVKK